MIRKDEKLYFTVDFECVNIRGTWLSYGAVLSAYPSRRVISSIQATCHRSESEYDTHTLQFWKKHPEAHRSILVEASPNIAVNTLERHMCEYVRGVLNTYPNVFVVSDNPQFDIRILDNMLTQHGYPPVSYRPNGRYFQTLCTWSYRQAILGVLPSRTRSVLSRHAISSRTSMSQLDSLKGVAHTPIHDCANILESHYAHLDILSNLGTYNPRNIGILQRGNINAVEKLR